MQTGTVRLGALRAIPHPALGAHLRAGLEVYMRIRLRAIDPALHVIADPVTTIESSLSRHRGIRRSAVGRRRNPKSTVDHRSTLALVDFVEPALGDHAQERVALRVDKMLLPLQSLGAWPGAGIRG